MNNINVGGLIAKRQNEDVPIQYLAAQRRLYSIGKSWYWAQLIIAVPIPILLSAVEALTDGSFLSWFIPLYAILAATSELMIERHVTKLKEKAASIQELFDCYVLNLERHEILEAIQIDSEEIRRSYNAYVKTKSLNNLFDWYTSEIAGVSTNIAKVVCQRSNCRYDFSLRQHYTIILKCIGFGTLALLLLISTIGNFSFRDVLTFGLIPSLPVLVLIYKQIESNKQTIDNLNKLKDLIQSIINSSNINSVIDESLIRQIQDKIYLNRANGPLVPDKIYNTRRPKHEDELYYSVLMVIRDLNSRT